MPDSNDHTDNPLVVILGASPKPARYANQAMKLLQQHHYRVIPVHPNFSEIEGVKVIHQLSDISEKVHTLTLYVGAKGLVPITQEILQLQPGRVIFNPGTESPELQKELDLAGIPWQQDCTLIMLNQQRF